MHAPTTLLTTTKICFGHCVLTLIWPFFIKYRLMPMPLFSDPLILRFDTILRPVGRKNSGTDQMNFPIAQMNSRIGQTDLPVAQMNSRVGQMNSPVAQMNLPVGQMNSRVGQMNLPVAQMNSRVGQVRMWDIKMTTGLGRDAGRDFKKLYCLTFNHLSNEQRTKHLLPHVPK